MSRDNNPTFEDRMKRLEEIVKALESADISLEEGLALYREGAICSRYCREMLEKARHEVELWQDGAGAPLDDPLEGLEDVDEGAGE